ncbi:hypothetical protein I302_105296 [Kwoniella bestiolae CBS 10118]|uniref:XPG-I domain-containing protein n=1 Tax=Kwoniella bestiolae CBS 10118 TaxID=1296100 RepID=A0A1B9FSR2_9TREE|nr:hypothetical protein I302_08584 [Kwoniella bestiolae CBS 10118]OCF21805.1 hypothetical protein I302_08584 [Kwoniella bestiolae CBS 10118]
MGVPGLWDLLRPAAARTSLSALSKEAFQANRNGLRALTIGIDASIWIFHAQVTHHGENPFLRTIFFRITALLQHPVLPVFVFDGPNKPGQKRNQNVAGQFGMADHKSKQFKALLDVCGLEWWNAPGEAEAELAVMNRQGKIDAVLSDDVDALLFGATCLLRNNSPTLSGAQANIARGDMRNYEVYRSSAIKDLWTKKEGTALSTEEDCRMAMVLIALLGGGDYTPEGLPSIGPTISFGLANAGLADFLKKYTSDRSTFDSHLPSIHSQIVEELRTNSQKQIGRKYPDRANRLSLLSPSAVFPSLTLDAYLNPCTSPMNDLSQGWPGFGKGEPSRTRGKARNEGRGDMEGLAIACEKYFEWGTKELVVKKFAGENVGVFGAEVMNEARSTVRSRVQQDPIPLVHQLVGTSKSASTSMITSFFSQSMPSSSPIIPKSTQPSQAAHSHEDDEEYGEPPNHVLKIHSKRLDPTNGEMVEYRISFQHAGYTRRCHDSMEGTRINPDDLSDNTRQNIGLRDRSESMDSDLPSGTQAANKPKDEIRVWLAEYLVKEAWPKLVQEYAEEELAKANAKKSPKKKKTLTKPPPKKGKGKGKSLPVEKMNVGVFDAFYSAAAGTTQKARNVISSESEEEEEPIENLPPRPRSRSASSPSTHRRSPSVPDSTGKKTKARPCPTSSLTSILDSSPSRGNSPTPKATAKTRNRPKAKTKRTTSPSPSGAIDPELEPEAGNTQSKRSVSPKRPSSPKRWFGAKRIFSKSKSSPSAFQVGKKDQPIDLCSSSDGETPVQPPRARRGSRNKNITSLSSSPPTISNDLDTLIPTRSPSTSKGRKKNIHSEYIEVSPKSSPSLLPVLEDSSRPNTISSNSDSPLEPKAPKTTKPKRRNSKSKSKSDKLSEPAQKGLLDFSIDHSTLFPLSDASKNKKKTPSPKKVKEKKKRYVVVSETSDEEVIDCT